MKKAWKHFSVIVTLLVMVVFMNRNAFADVYVSSSDVEDMVNKGISAYNNGNTAYQVTGYSSDTCGRFVYGYCLNKSTLGQTIPIPSNYIGPCEGGVNYLLGINAGTLYVTCTGSVQQGNASYYTNLYKTQSGCAGNNVVQVSDFTPQRGDIVLFGWQSKYRSHVAIMTSSTRYVHASGNTIFYNSMGETASANGRAMRESVIGYFRFNTGSGPSTPPPNYITKCKYNVTIPANFTLQCYETETSTVKYKYYYPAGYSYTLECDQLYMSPVTSRFRIKENGWWFTYDAAMTWKAVHDFSTFSGFESAHPHRMIYTCTCGEKSYGSDRYVSSCLTCNPFYSLSFVANNGTIEGDEVIYYQSGSALLNMPTAVSTREGYEFAGWFTAEEGGIEYPENSIMYVGDGVKTLYAHWNKVWACADGHTPVIDEGVKATYSASGLTEGSHCAVCSEVIVEQHTIPRLKLPFTDVAKTAYYYNSVAYMLDHGYMNGTSATTFKPTNELTRGMMVIILWNISGKPKITARFPFTDVASTASYYNAVKWAYAEGVVSGKTTTTFAPKDTITRQQLVVMLYNYYTKYCKKTVENLADINGYQDISAVSSYAKTAFRWAVGNNIISGKSGGTKLDPKGAATRAEVAAMVTKFCKNVYFK